MEACDEYMCRNPGKVVTIYQLLQLFASAFAKAFTPQNIVSSFRVTGVFPPNRKAIPIPGIQEISKCKSTPTAKIAESNGINYLPFYTPGKPSLPKHSPFSSDVHPCFTEAELQRFEKSFKEGYDITTNERYNRKVSIAQHTHQVNSLRLLKS